MSEPDLDRSEQQPRGSGRPSDPSTESGDCLSGTAYESAELPTHQQLATTNQRRREFRSDARRALGRPAGERFKTKSGLNIVVVGGGPAGVAAAVTAASADPTARVTLIDDNPALGGQIWRQGAAPEPAVGARKWLRRLDQLGVERRCPATVIDTPSPGRLVVADAEGTSELAYHRLIVATGATERFLPFPGWTLPGVLGAGALQALVKGGLDVRGLRIVIAGTGPLLLAVTDLVRRRGGRVVALAEQADFSSVMTFGRSMWRSPSKGLQALGFAQSLWNVPYRFATWPARAEGEGQLERVVLVNPLGEANVVECDLLACGFGLRPNVALAQALSCDVVDGRVVVDDRQQTIVDGVYCAGEPTGIGGLDNALLQGRIAGLAAVGRSEEVRSLSRRRRREQRFVAVLEKAFRLRSELRSLPETDTIVCRCEDVTWGRVREFDDVRDCKLKTRCGMGPCQGRVCGGALEFLKGFRPETPRPPFFPVTLNTLAPTGASERTPASEDAPEE